MKYKLKYPKTRDAAIEQVVKEFNKAIDKAYKEIKRTGYPENHPIIVKTDIKIFW